ncbi:hypothetical protein Dimus_038976 [Dionaea muscipula]
MFVMLQLVIPLYVLVVMTSTSETTESKIGVSEVISVTTKLIEQRLDGENYFHWKKMILFAIRGMEMEDHLTQESPSDAKEPLKAKLWARDDARLYTRLINSMEPRVSTLVSHCDSVKEL